MNIKIKDDSSEILEKFCRNTSQTPSKVIESLIDVLYPVYLDYEKRRDAEIEKRSFNQVLSDLLRHISNSTVENLDVAPKLIETTNRVLGIKNYIGASIFDIQLDFDKRSISYFVGYRSCTNLNYAFTALAISVEINQDHIQISELVYEPILESQEITDIELREIEDFIQHLIECTHSKELQPFVNVSVHLFLMGSHPFAPKSDLYETIRIELTFKVDSADHIPSIERMGAIVKNVQYIIKEKVLKQ